MDSSSDRSFFFSFIFYTSISYHTLILFEQIEETGIMLRFVRQSRSSPMSHFYLGIGAPSINILSPSSSFS